MSACDVNIATGEVKQFYVDFAFPSIIPLHFIRTYSSALTTKDVGLGFGWKHNLTFSLTLEQHKLVLKSEDYQDIKFPILDVGQEMQDEPSGLKLRRTVGELIVVEPDLNKLIFSIAQGRESLWYLSRKEDPYGNALHFEFDAAGRLLSVIDSWSRVFTFHYIDGSHLTDVTVQVGDSATLATRLLSLKYDSRGDLISFIDRTGVPQEFSYRDHLLVSVTNRIGGKSFYQYNNNKQCVRTWQDSGAQFREMRYDQKKRTIAVMNGLGLVTIYRNNDMGLTEEEVDPIGRVKRDAYDPNGKVLVSTSETGGIEQVTSYDKVTGKLIVASSGGETQFTLNAEGKPTEVIDQAGCKTFYEYDYGGNLTRMVTPLGAEWRFEYSQNGQLSKATDPCGVMIRRKRTRELLTYEDDLGVLSFVRFDDLGNAVLVRDGRSNETRLEYDSAGRMSSISNPDGHSRVFVRDAEGNIIEMRDETGLVTRYKYDGHGTLLEIIEPGDKRLQFAYDMEENLSTITNFGGEIARFEYDPVGRPLSQEYFDGRIERYGYDDHDNIVAILDGRGDVLSQLTYDDAGRVEKRLRRDGVEEVFAYGPKNEVVAIEKAGIRIDFEWDSEMRIVKEQCGTNALEYEYDALGNRTKLTDSSGRTIEYEWDQRNRLSAIVDGGQYRYQYSYNEADLVKEIVLPGGLRVQLSYDNCNRMDEQSVDVRGSAGMWRRIFSYDGADRLLRKEETGRGIVEYRYDERERLSKVFVDGAAVEQYEYDAEGNLTRLRTGDQVTVGAGNHIMECGGRPFGYDSSGNLVHGPSNRVDLRYEYGADGELLRIVCETGIIAEYAYDPLGRRVRKTEGGRVTEYVWDGVALLGEKTNNGDETSYLFLPGSFLPVGQTHMGRHCSYLFDQLGTPTHLFKMEGEIAWTARYSGFGELLESTGPSASSPFRFQGQYADDESGLSYNRHRYYDPRLGRFLTPDPIGFAGGVNSYVYGPNPINWVDPFGLFECDIKPKCSWSTAQQKDAEKKMDAANNQLGSGKTIPKKIPAACDKRKNAKKIYNKCVKQGKVPLLTETSSKCSNQQADHILEVVAGGDEKDCDNLQPLNESVNKSYGSQMKSCVNKNRGQVLTAIKLLPMSDCRPGGRKCPG